MKRLIIVIALATLPAPATAERVAVTVTGPSQQTTVLQQSTVVAPQSITVNALVNVTGTETTTLAVPGPQGPAGPQGPTGAAGPAGSAGFVPVLGVHYYDGRDGINGINGINGTNGAAGHSPALTWSADQIAIDGSVTGPHLTGPQGPQGDPGPSGSPDTADQIREKLRAPQDGANIVSRQGPTEAGTEPKMEVDDTIGNTRFYVNGDGTIFSKAADGSIGFAAGNSGVTVGAERPLGNPSTNGYCLQSTAAGARSWGVCGSGGGSETRATIIGKINETPADNTLKLQYKKASGADCFTVDPAAGTVTITCTLVIK